MTNAFRDNAADMSVAMFALKIQGHNHYDTPENIAGDLIEAVLHFIDDRGGNALEKVRLAKDNFQAEKATEQAGRELVL